jgi:hypothetical protein
MLRWHGEDVASRCKKSARRGRRKRKGANVLGNVFEFRPSLQILRADLDGNRAGTRGVQIPIDVIFLVLDELFSLLRAEVVAE